MHNVATGREAELPHVIATSATLNKRVVIAGAGVAGLEAARVAASEGHQVTVIEATNQVGGQFNLACATATTPRNAGSQWLALWRVPSLRSAV